MNYKVIEIIDLYTIIIDYGTLAGAKEGTSVRVYSEGEEVIHPESNEVIGTLDFVKEKLEIVTAFAKFSICKKVKRTSAIANIAQMSPLNSYREEVRPINVNPEDLSNRNMTFDSRIQLGDKVIILD